jgi:hypothetical protein
MKKLTNGKNTKQLEEQGRLAKLPCKVGDKIFLDFAGFGKDVDKFTVKDFHLDCFKNGETILFCDYESNDKTLSGQIDVMEFGKTVFLTKSEAEAKLKELRGGENDKQSNLTDKEMEDLQSIVTDTLASVCAMADKNNIDRDSMLKYFADMLTAFTEVASIQNYETNHTCNCQHNSNSRENEPCCGCDNRQTNADRIRNMSDEELAEFLITFKNTFGEEYEGEASCMDWLQSEVE